jgi:hypothetical protein
MNTSFSSIAPDQTAENLRRLQRATHVVTHETPVGPALDLDLSAAQPPDDAPSHASAERRPGRESARTSRK